MASEKLKKCKNCLKTLSIQEFSTYPDKLKNGTSIRRLLGNCKLCVSEKQKQWKAVNKQKVKSYYSDNREKYLANSKAYQKANIARAKALMARARARKIKRIPKWADNEETLQKIIEIYQKATNLTNETGVSYEVDHIIPLMHSDVCGLHIPENLQIITAAENIVKMDTWDGTNNNESWKKEIILLIKNLADKYNV